MEKNYTDKKLLNRDTIKYIAIVAMAINHFATIFMDYGSVLRVLFLGVGNFTAITMCYFLVEGYAYTHSKKSYAKRLLLFAILSQIPYYMAFVKPQQNVFVGFNMLFTLLLCFLICLIWEKVSNILIKVSLLLIICACSMKCDWGIGAPVFTILFIWSRDSVFKKKIAFMIPTVLFGIYNFAGRFGRVTLDYCILNTVVCMFGMGMAGVCILYFYNGKKAKGAGMFSKWFFYIFYPLHLLIFGIIRMFL